MEFNIYSESHIAPIFGLFSNSFHSQIFMLHEL